MSSTTTPGRLTPVLTDAWDADRAWTLKAYRKTGGYEALAQALRSDPAEIVDTIKASGLRGRGGAGFPTGLKWSFLPPPDGGPRYLVVNADESEPGACKDVPLMLAKPHLLLEGVAITAYAIGCTHAFIYLRGEVVHVYRRLLAAVREATEAGLLGPGAGPDGGFGLTITVHAGAGAYICGEETALLDSLEGMRGQPRLKPPFPAVAGLYARPTVVNNVESIASVPAIVRGGVDWFTSMGTEKSAGHGIFSLSGHVERPGQYEAPLGITMRELLDMAGGVRVITRWTDFYQHESCGKCTPCREGTYWMKQVMHRLEDGRGQPGDIELLLDVSANIAGRSFCALGDASAVPIQSGIAHFRAEFEAGMHTPAAELFPYEASAAFSEVGAR